MMKFLTFFIVFIRKFVSASGCEQSWKKKGLPEPFPTLNDMG